MTPFQRFYEQHRERFFAYLLRLTGDRETAGDLLQESFTRYLERYGRGRCEPRLLYTIGRNAAFDLFRSQQRSLPLRVDAAAPRGNPEHDVVVRQTHRRLLRALDRLVPIEREVLSLAASGDLTYREIGVIVGISEANVKVRVHRARVKLRNMMKEEGHEGRTHQPVHR